MLHEMVSRLPLVSFSSSKQNSQGENVNVQPLVLDFRKLLTGPKLNEEIVPGIQNKDLLHATVALFDSALPEVTTDLIYSVLCEKWARTILLIENEVEALANLKKQAKVLNQKEKRLNVEIKEETLTKDTYVAELSMYAGVYSDMDMSSESESEEENETDFSEGDKEFVKQVRERKRQLNSNEGDSFAVGIEHRLVACASYERSYDKPGHKVLHLTLIAVRKKWRKFGIGKYLIELLKNPQISTEFDVIVVNADYKAVDFFEKQQFTDDVLTNSPYANIGDTWFQSKRMCFLPSYMQTSLASMQILPDLDLKEMELDIAIWREKSLQCYQGQSALVQKLRQEVLQLRALNSLQFDKIKQLSEENDKLQDDKLYLEQKLLQQRLDFLNITTDTLLTFGGEDIPVTKQNSPLHNNDEITKRLESKFKADFLTFNKGPVEITNIKLSDSKHENAFIERSKLLKDPDVVTDLYYCGGKNKDAKFFEDILINGFCKENFSNSEFATGLYFSDYLQTAVRFSTSSCVLIAKLGLGKIETVTSTNSNRTDVPNPNEFDSILTPGRLSLTNEIGSNADTPQKPRKIQTTESEYVVFDTSQAMPVALVEYKITN